jgi:hypothetical protein
MSAGSTMITMPAKEKMDEIELELDTRLLRVWDMLSDEQFSDEIARTFSLYIRWAYTLGYIDACNDDDPGKWARNFGYDLKPKTKKV